MRFKKNNPVLVSRKMKLGAAIITLTSILSACTGNTAVEQDTCYKKASDDTLIKTVKTDSVITNETLKKETQNDLPNKKYLKKIKNGAIKDTLITIPPIQNATCYAPVNINDTL